MNEGMSPAEEAMGLDKVKKRKKLKTDYETIQIDTSPNLLVRSARDTPRPHDG